MMGKDLREAHKAMQLMRADLLHTREEKALLETQLQMFKQQQFEQEQTLREQVQALQQREQALLAKNSMLLHEKEQSDAAPEDNQEEEEKQALLQLNLQVITLHQTLEQVENERNALKNQLNDALAAIQNHKTVEVELERSKERVVALENQVEHLKTEQTALETKLQQANEASERNESPTSWQEEKEALQKAQEEQKSAWKAEKQALLSSIRALERAVRQTQDEAEAQKQQYEADQSENDQAWKEENERLERSLEELDQALRTLQLDHEHVVEATIHLERQVQERASECTKKDEQLQHLEQVKKCLEVDFQAKQSELTREIASWRHQADEAKRELVQVRQEHAKEREQATTNAQTELQKLKQHIQHAEEELMDVRDEAEASRKLLLEMEERYDDARALADVMEKRNATYEATLMAMHDRLPSQQEELDELDELWYDCTVQNYSMDATHRLWNDIKRQVRQLREDLPQIASFVSTVQHLLVFCIDNADVLMQDSRSEATITHGLVDVMRLALQISSLNRPKLLHLPLLDHLEHRVTECLAQWHEYGAETSLNDTALPPPPAFDITSPEADLILQNWTNDVAKRTRAKQWLYAMAHLRDWPIDPDTRQSMPPNLLELEGLTMQVKDAFLMLMVPILKQNRRILVRTFTRKALQAQRIQEHEEDRSWQMRIVIQPSKEVSTARPLQRRRSSVTSTSSSNGSSEHTMTLQLIQERLAQLQQQRSDAA